VVFEQGFLQICQPPTHLYLSLSVVLSSATWLAGNSSQLHITKTAALLAAAAAAAGDMLLVQR
jgi:hypothetical protein